MTKCTSSGYQENTSEVATRWHFTFTRMAKIKLTKPSADEDVEPLELAYTAGRDTKGSNHLEKQYNGLLKS